MEQKLTILLVEDETTYAQLIELFLLDYGHQIHTVYSITDARHLLQHQFDLLIADVNLPDGDGIDFAQLARAKWPELSVIFITGYSTRIPSEHNQENKTLFLKKPFPLKQLLESITLLTQEAD